MGDRDAKFATENLVFAASRIERGRDDGNVVELSRLEKQKGQRLSANPFNIWLPDLGVLRTKSIFIELPDRFVKKAA